MGKLSFDVVLDKFIKHSGQSLPRLEERSAVPQKTIESWLEGRVKHPRKAVDLLELAKAMRLNLAETNELLAAANHKSVQALLAEAREQNAKTALDLLAFWVEEQDRHVAAVQRSQTAIFQAIPALTNLVGRGQEYEQLKNILLSGGRICVLRGMSGVGKTVLAAKAAHELRPTFPDGVLWAQLDQSDADAILRSFAKAYGQDVSDYHDLGTLSANVRNLFANKKALIILDAAYSEEPIRTLLPAVTGGAAVIITTTRRKLLESEAVTIDLKPFDQDDSLALFRTKLGKTRVDEAESELQQIITLVGGLPLALKIIAANLPTSMTVQEYYDLLRDEEIRRLHLYEGDESSKQARLSFEVSYKLLPSRWKKLIGYLSLFKGADFSVEAVAAVAQVATGPVKMDLNHLLTLSLIEETSVDQPLQKTLGVQPALTRYRQHALLAFFGAEKFAEDFPDQLAPSQQRAAVYYANFVQRYKAHYAVLEVEWRNLFAALPWLLEVNQPHEFEQAVEALTTLQLGAAGFLDGQGHWREAVQLLAMRQNSKLPAVDQLVQANILTKLGLFHLRLAEYGQAEHYLQQVDTLVAPLPESIATITCQAYACEVQAQLLLAQGATEQASGCIAQGLTHLQHFQVREQQQTASLAPIEGYLLVRHATIVARSGDLTTAQTEIEQALSKLPPAPTAARVSALLTLGNIHDLQGEVALAEKCFLEGVEVATAIGDNRRLADLWRNLAIHAEEAGDFESCTNYNKQALDLYRRIGDVVGQGAVAANLSVTYLRQAKPGKALAHIQETQRIADTHQIAHLALYASVNLAHYYLLRAEYRIANDLLTTAQRQCEHLGEPETLAEILRLQAQVAFQQGAYPQALQLITASIMAAGANEGEAATSRQVQTEILAHQQRHQD